MAANTIYMQALTDEEQRRRALQAQQDLARQQSGLTKAGITTLPGKPGDPWEGLTTLPGSPGDSLENNLTLYNAPQNSYQRALQAAQTAVPQTTQTATQKRASAVQLAANDPENKLAANEARMAQLAAQAQQGAAQASSSALPTNNNKALGQVSQLVSAAKAPAQSQAATDTVYNTGKTVISPENYQIYRAYRRKDDSFTGNMGAADRAAWNAIGAKYAAGDQSWLTDTNEFRKDGNWSSYYDDNGNINGWLYAANGVGNYAPVFGGKVGETGYKPGTVFYGPDDTAYILDRDGTLVRSGDVVWAKYGEYFGPTGGYHQDGTSFYSPDASGKIQKYDYATAPDDILEANGYYRTSSGALAPITAEYRRAQAMKSGELTPEQAAVAAYNAYNRNGSSVRAASGGSTPGAGNIYSSYLNNYDYNGGNYGNYNPTDYRARRDAALRRAEGMEWDYDPYTDPVWQAYQKQYRREGDRATKETMAQAAAMTGGIPSSYAATAASQAGDYYAAQLSDKIPQLYQDAYNRYLQEFQKQLQISDQYQGFDDREYSRQYQAQRDAISDARYDQEWAQKLREYADEQSWKAKDWEQYLREYGDQLSEKEREWAYQMSRDAVSDQRYADETAYNRGKYEDETAYQRVMYDREYADEQDQNAWERGYKQTAYNDEMWRIALNYLNTNGIVTGRYAEILGVPDGTTYEQYYSRYLGGSTSPFEETELDSGQIGTPKVQDDTPKTSKTPSGDDQTPKTPAGNDQTPKTPEGPETVPGVVHENGKPMTKGFQKYWATFRDAYDQGASAAEIIQAVESLIRKGELADYEREVILRKLGILGRGGGGGR